MTASETLAFSKTEVEGRQSELAELLAQAYPYLNDRTQRRQLAITATALHVLALDMAVWLGRNESPETSNKLIWLWKDYADAAFKRQGIMEEVRGEE